MDLPVPTGWWVDGVRRDPQPSWTVVDTHDQHAFMEGSDPMPSPGDVLTLGVSHPCTTFDKWRQVLAVDDDDVVTAVWQTHFS
jgi:D-serine deaminase-like pyridoxal phosphate-dependent protein